MVEVASTGVDGFALQNGTPTILSWTAPSTGGLRTAQVSGYLDVTSQETGGTLLVVLKNPGSTQLLDAIFISGGGTAPGVYWPNGADVVFPLAVLPGYSVELVQSSPLTAGAATVFAQIFAS